MTSQEKNVDDLTYRLILLLPDSQEVLVLKTGVGDCLPSVRIPRRTRIARELQQAIQMTWKLHVIILDIPKQGDGVLPCAIVEVLFSHKRAELHAVDISQMMAFGLDEQLCTLLVSASNDKSFAASPFSRIGWIDEATAWVEEETGKRISSKSQIEQYNAGEGFSLILFRMEDKSDYWLKATGGSNAHELAVTCLLSKLAKGYLPRIISTKPAWNAWLMCGDAKQKRELPADSFRLIEDAVESMAALQLKTIGQRPNLLAAGAFDQSMTVFQQHSETLFNFLEEAMRWQTSTKAPCLDAARLREIRVIFEDASRRMEDLDLPQTIVHGDMSWGNILEGHNHCQFIDWSEAYIGCPFVTLQHLLLLHQEEGSEVWCRRNALLKDRYKSVWLPTCNARAIEEGFVYMELLAVASAIYGRCDWLTTSSRDDPRYQAYGRNLARHMDRAARAPELLEALRCRLMLAPG